MKENLAKRLVAEPALETVTDIIGACEDAKGKDAIVLDVHECVGLVDYFIVVSGRSDRQAQGIANRIIETLGKKGVEATSLEGFETGHWILLDFDDVVVHVFYEPLGEVYDLETLWKKAPRVQLTKRYPAQRKATRSSTAAQSLDAT